MSKEIPIFKLSSDDLIPVTLGEFTKKIKEIKKFGWDIPILIGLTNPASAGLIREDLPVLTYLVIHKYKTMVLGIVPISTVAYLYKDIDEIIASYKKQSLRKKMYNFLYYSFLFMVNFIICSYLYLSK